MLIRGKIASWNEDKECGLAIPLSGGKQVFVDISAFSDRSSRPQVNDIVTLELASEQQGRPCATQAMLYKDKPQEKAEEISPAFIVFALGFLAVVGLAVMTGRLPAFIGIAYAALSVITFAIYAFDKPVATSGAWWGMDGDLHLLGLAGGWPGVLIAQETLRHKSKKAGFHAALWATVLINGAAFLWLLTADGNAALEGFLRR